MSTAVADELVVRNPCQIRGAGTPEAAERPMVPTTSVMQLADAVVAIDHTKYRDGPSRLRAFVLIAGFGGLRPGELLALRREDLDLLHHNVTVDENAPAVDGRRVLGPPKSEAGYRTVALPASIMVDIKEHLERFVSPEPDAWVFTGPKGRAMSQDYASLYWRKAVAAVPGVPPWLRLYDLRHHAATLTARIPGVTTKELMARIGHSSPRAALIYQHATAERDRRIADAMDAEIAAAAGEANVVSFGLPVASKRRIRRNSA
jgi:integrase